MSNMEQGQCKGKLAGSREQALPERHYPNFEKQAPVHACGSPAVEGSERPRMTVKLKEGSEYRAATRAGEAALTFTASIELRKLQARHENQRKHGGQLFTANVLLEPVMQCQGG